MSKGLVKIPRIFLAQPLFTSLAHVLDKSALYGKGISLAGMQSRRHGLLEFGAEKGSGS